MTSLVSRSGGMRWAQASNDSPPASKSIISPLPDTRPQMMHKAPGPLANQADTSADVGSLLRYCFHRPTAGRFSARRAGSAQSPAAR